MKTLCGLCLLILAMAGVALLAEDAPPKLDFQPLFNGKDLTGWVNVNCAPGSFFVKDNEIITTGEPIGFLRTEKQYENFILELEWKHVREKGMANSGLFVWGDALPGVGSPFTRGIEVQILINFETDWATSHGDVFSVQDAKCIPDRPHPRGYARCLPSEKRVKGAGEWNHYKVIANDGIIKLHVNGKEVSGVSQCTPRKGYLALESEGSECHFRNIRIHELPSKNPKPEQCATVEEGFRSRFDGLSLSGWTAEPGTWAVRGGKLICLKKGELKLADLPEGEVILDWLGPTAERATLSGHAGTTPLNFSGTAKKWKRERFPTNGSVTLRGEPGHEVMNVFFKKKS